MLRLAAGASDQKVAEAFKGPYNQPIIISINVITIIIMIISITIYIYIYRYIQR